MAAADQQPPAPSSAPSPWEQRSPTDFLDSEGYSIVGGRCSLDTCQERDFLPFTCDYCQGSFCAAHLQAAAHGCSQAPVSSRGVLAAVCPACEETLRWVDGESSEEAAMLAHQAVCRGKPQQPPRPLCPVEGCKQVLRASNSVVCSRCRLKVCMAHRYQDDHNCGKLKSRWLEQVAATSATATPAAASGAPAGAGVVAAPAAAASGGRAGGGARTAASDAPAAAAAAEARIAAMDVAKAMRRRAEQLRGALAGTAEANEACTRTVRRLFENAAAAPDDPKLRVVRRDNKAIRTKILDVPAGEALLVRLGFESRGETFELPATVSREQLREIAQLLV